MDFLKNVAVTTVSLVCAGLFLKVVGNVATAVVEAVEKKEEKVPQPVASAPAPTAV